jgi:hypothetical protein
MQSVQEKDSEMIFAEDQEEDQRSDNSDGDYIPRERPKRVSFFAEQKEYEEEEEEMDRQFTAMSNPGETYTPHRRQGIRASSASAILYEEETDSYNESPYRGPRVQPRPSFGRISSDGKDSGTTTSRRVLKRSSPVIQSTSTIGKTLPVAPESMLQRVLRSVWPGRRRQDTSSMPDGKPLDQDTALGMAFGGASNQFDNMVAAAAVVSGSVAASDFRTQRRYNVGDYALVVGHVAPKRIDEDDTYDYQYLDPIQKQKLIYNPVNKYGFPPGKGGTEEELRPPYVYVLAKVTKVHFEEDARYYTVIREDNQLEQRADSEFMEPILSEKAKQAAMEAAHTKQVPLHHHSFAGLNDLEKSLAQRSEESKIWKYCCLCAHFVDCILLTLKSTFSCCTHRILPPLSSAAKWSYHFAKTQARLILNGLKPYECNLRLTYVNVLVLCSLIFMFSDTIRLALLPPSSDVATIWISFVAWLLLVLELFFEVFIRPKGYCALIHSEKAFAPSTARYINGFHLAMEVIALLFYIPEISCIFRNNNSCSDESKLNLLNATFLASLGQSNVFLDLNSFPNKAVFVGNCMLATLRLRVFGIVRFWKRMWINRSFIQNESGCLQRFLPPRAVDSEGTGRATLSTENNTKTIKKNEADINVEDDNSIDLEMDTAKANAPKPPSKEEDLRLKNAATIGTALLVINSHRTILVV